MMSFKQQCIKLREEDKTLNEIVKITGRSKTSVYFHIKDIPLSKIKIKDIKKSYSQRAISLSAARKGKALRPYRQFKEWTPDLVLLVGHLLFDGEISKKKCTYNNRSKVLIDRVVNLVGILYDYPPNFREDKKSGVIRVQFNNVELGSFLYQKSRELLMDIENMPKEYQREFLRAFFDDEGCMNVSMDSNMRRIRGYQKDKVILIIIKNLLGNFLIESKLREPNEVVITGKENLLKFQKEINFSAGVRLNPNRANSIWKKPIEKRWLLDKAIKSFKI